MLLNWQKIVIRTILGSSLLGLSVYLFLIVAERWKAHFHYHGLDPGPHIVLSLSTLEVGCAALLLGGILSYWTYRQARLANDSLNQWIAGGTLFLVVFTSIALFVLVLLPTTGLTLVR